MFQYLKRNNQSVVSSIYILHQVETDMAFNRCIANRKMLT